ncbi:cytochrome P450 714C2 [Ziziphus jujuba]|uniref:Cytochrome P450 714C2 n=1 Tax=Ziziphus jujuba TaxID=326968 RepID=A0A6P3Z9W6_ZIZJJ|nr:cytochrome P450 714C2 [Ziziphus jujuba]
MEDVFGVKTSIVCFSILLLVYIYYKLGVKSEIIRAKLRKQGISGPLPSIVLGNVPEIRRIMSEASSKGVKENNLQLVDHSLSLFPYFKKWTKQFGRTFMFALGGVQLLYVCDAEIVRELSIFKSLDLGKPAYLQKDRGPLLGKGLITTNGTLWAHQRKTIAPHLYMYKIKDMVNLVVESANTLVKAWESRVDQTAHGGAVDIPVHDYVRSFSSNVISNILFGSNYREGNMIFPKYRALLNAMASPTILNGIPFSRFFPTKKNMQVWRLEKEINSMIIDIKNKHIGRPHDEDMLKGIMAGAKNAKLGPNAEDQYLVDNCKNLFLAGSEVPAVAAMWGLMLLALYPEWQARIRSEVEQVCGNPNIIDASVLHKMKVIEMVIQEVLRLYPAVIFVSRQALEEIKVGKMWVPKGVNIWIWMLELHRDPELWGPDAHKFNPERFANGVTGACKCPQAYLPFGVGGRVCPGQSLAMVELKILFALIVSNFNLSVSPNYHHSPVYGLLLQPEHGVNLLVQKI